MNSHVRMMIVSNVTKSVEYVDNVFMEDGELNAKKRVLLRTVKDTSVTRLQVIVCSVLTITGEETVH